MACKLFTFQEIKQKIDCDNTTLIVINDSVYDVTCFLNEHPGGEEVLLEQVGKDASEAFEDVGHSSDARDMMRQYKIGELVESEKSKKGEKKPVSPNTNSGESESTWKSWLVPITIGLLATIVYRFYFLSQ